MDQLKKNLFWIILGVVVLGALIGWFVMQPDPVKDDALKPAKDVHTAALSAAKPNGLLTPNHGKAADEFGKKLEADRNALMDAMKAWPDMSERKLELRYKDAPPAARSIEFDNWMDLQRKRLHQKLEAANVQAHANFDRDLFFGTNVDSSPNPDVKRHRDYQLRVLNIMEETVDALCIKAGVVPITSFETDPAKPEPQSTVPAGVLKMDSFTYHLPNDTAEINRKAFLYALTKTGVYKAPANPLESVFKGVEMPVSVSSVDIEFVGNLAAVPAILKKLEASDKYFAVLARADFEREDKKVFPGPASDTKVQADYAKAEYKPMMNTHYGEGPVKMLVTLEFFEFDKAKAEKMTALPPKAGAGGAAPNKPNTPR